MGKVLDWFVAPIVDIFEGEKVALDEIGHTLPAGIPNKQFRPLTFTDYIGQDRAKRQLKSYIEGVKVRKRIFPHVLIHGSAGCGKTTLARIIANELKVPFVESITSEINDFFDIEMKLLGADGGVLFLDELHSLPRGTAESMYTVMEDFMHDGISIKEFTLMGATTELGEILKTRRPFYDRFKIIIELEDYTPEELGKIAKQYKQKTFPKDEVISDEIYTLIGKNCRRTPRTALRLLESTIYLNGNIAQTLENYAILKDGYTRKDLVILEFIAKNQNGVGLQGIGSYLGESSENYLYQNEPFLLRNGLILRTSKGRKISEAGATKILELREEGKKSRSREGNTVLGNVL